MPGRNVSVQSHDVAGVVTLHVRQVAPDPVEVVGVEGAPVERVGYHPLVRTPEVGSVTARRLVGSGLDYPTPTVSVQLDLRNVAFLKSAHIFIILWASITRDRSGFFKL